MRRLNFHFARIVLADHFDRAPDVPGAARRETAGVTDLGRPESPGRLPSCFACPPRPARRTSRTPQNRARDAGPRIATLWEYRLRHRSCSSQIPARRRGTARRGSPSHRRLGPMRTGAPSLRAAPSPGQALPSAGLALERCSPERGYWGVRCHLRPAARLARSPPESRSDRVRRQRREIRSRQLPRRRRQRPRGEVGSLFGRAHGAAGRLRRERCVRGRGRLPPFLRASSPASRPARGSVRRVDAATLRAGSDRRAPALD
jgi:hypothetical protein